MAAAVQSVLQSALQTLMVPAMAKPLVELCGPAGVVCIDDYAAAIPDHFYRDNSEPAGQALKWVELYGEDKSWDLVADAQFVVFDRELGLELLGPNPSVKLMFNVSADVHEAPVYLPEQNLFVFSQLSVGQLPLFAVDLNQSPPTLSEFTPDPPIYVPNGAYYSDGLVWFAASGGNDTSSGKEFKPSLQTFDPKTNKSELLLNNYMGYYFNTIDDLAIHPITKDVWFTDPDYSWYTGISDTAPQLPTATWRFDPQTKATYIVDEDLVQPDGICFSPDGKILYLGDSGAYSGSNKPEDRGKGDTWESTGRRTIYAYTLNDDYTLPINKQVLYFAGNGATDGVRAAANGYIVTATGDGLDVITATGRLLVRVQTTFPVQNFIWTGKDFDSLWLTGKGGIAKVELNLPGQMLQ